MAGLHHLMSPIPRDPKDLPLPLNTVEDMQKALTNLQGNILHAHGRAHATHIFVKCKAGQQADFKHWVSTLAGSITSAQRQHDEWEQQRHHGIPPGLFVNFFLSASGYKALGFDLSKFGPEQQAFRYGMKAASHRLNDAYEEAWDAAYRHDIHAMLLLADHDEFFLRQQVHKQLEDIKASVDVCAIEHGQIMRNTRHESIEHFGYADSLSQPRFFQQEIDAVKRREPQTSYSDPAAGLNLVLVPDPYGRGDSDSGSFLVFRKLEQNVRAYKEMENALATALGLTGQDAKRAGALVVGRFEDGTPVVLQPAAGRPTNGFDYVGDPEGEKCPFQAHIRKMNPRQAGAPRLVRRGMPYGQRWKEPGDNPTLEELPQKDVGLLFMCYQNNIEKQFEALQYFWANDPRQPLGQAPGIDPLIGQASALGPGQHRWPAQWNEPHATHKPFHFKGFVSLKGGEYLFAPSIYFLQHIHTY